jgi:hypothetical protein
VPLAFTFGFKNRLTGVFFFIGCFSDCSWSNARHHILRRPEHRNRGRFKALRNLESRLFLETAQHQTNIAHDVT